MMFKVGDRVRPANAEQAKHMHVSSLDQGSVARVSDNVCLIIWDSGIRYGDNGWCTLRLEKIGCDPMPDNTEYYAAITE